MLKIYLIWYDYSKVLVLFLFFHNFLFHISRWPRRVGSTQASPMSSGLSSTLTTEPSRDCKAMTAYLLSSLPWRRKVQSTSGTGWSRTHERWVTAEVKSCLFFSLDRKSFISDYWKCDQVCLFGWEVSLSVVWSVCHNFLKLHFNAPISVLVAYSGNS